MSYLNEVTMDTNIGTRKDIRLIKVGSWLTFKERERYQQLLIEFFDIFTWSYFDMLCLYPDLVTHSLGMNEDANLIQ